MMFLVVWLRVEKRRDFGGTHQFSLLPLQNTISPNWRENKSESWTKIFGQNYPHFLFIITIFFFRQPQPGVINVACLLFFFFPFFLLGFTVSLDVDFFFLIFFFINMMMCISAWTRDSPWYQCLFFWTFFLFNFVNLFLIFYWTWIFIFNKLWMIAFFLLVVCLIFS